MCSIDWALLGNWVAAVASLGTLFIAWKALKTWREQLRGASRHAIAQEVATAAYALRSAYYVARQDDVADWEYPPDETAELLYGRTRAQEAQRLEHAYKGRLERLRPYIIDLANLRPKAHALLGELVVSAIGDVALAAYDNASGYMRRRVERVRSGTISDGVETKVRNEDEPYARFFEKDFDALLDALKPDL